MVEYVSKLQQAIRIHNTDKKTVVPGLFDKQIVAFIVNTRRIRTMDLKENTQLFKVSLAHLN